MLNAEVLLGRAPSVSKAARLAHLGEARAVGPRCRLVRDAERHAVARGGRRKKEVDGGGVWVGCFLSCTALAHLGKARAVGSVLN